MGRGFSSFAKGHKSTASGILGVEEWAAQLVENHAMEAVQAARRALGRPICVRGLCSD